jgi:hypothetical protein
MGLVSHVGMSESIKLHELHLASYFVIRSRHICHHLLPGETRALILALPRFPPTTPCSLQVRTDVSCCM